MVGIVLAGGYSSRAKVNKLLLEVDRKPLICHTIETLKPYVDRVLVVTGRYHDELVPVLGNIDVVYNKDFSLGMFSSVFCGARECMDDALIIPGDITNVSGSTIKAVLSGTKDIRIPVSNDESGHPVYISKKYIELLTKESLDSRLCDFINKHKDVVEEIKVDDKFINFDVDTIDDYNRLRKELTLWKQNLSKEHLL